ncbi:Beta-mannosyltransferase 1 [Exophiala dermatitidis]
MSVPSFERFAVPARIQRLSIFALITILIFFFFPGSFFPDVTVPNLHRESYDSTPSEYYLQWGPFEPMDIPGFVNTGLPGKRSCDTLKYNSTVGVQKSFFLNDDIKQIAMTLDSHPIVDYPDDMMNDPSLKVTDIVERTWARLSGSSVWLPEHQVYLSVTRVIFCPQRTRSVPKMSFLRGQLFNADWEHLDNYNLTWGGKTFNFPLVFDIPANYDPDGSLYGPEDPRIILEDNVEGAEPVVIFNMIGKPSDWKRAMYIFRPFSNYSNLLTIRDHERQWTEKNWAPFFVPQYEQVSPSRVRLPGSEPARVPNDYIHFIYSFKPLRILKCHLRCGDCEFAYEQSVPEGFLSQHKEDGGSLRGGTNFVPVPIPASMKVDPKVKVWAAFPRTNIEGHCDGSFYRPEFVVMVKIEDHYHLAFASESLDFGNAIVELGPKDDRCGNGRIMIPNSIAQWDTSNGQDVMSVTFSVNDETVQVARVQGLLKFVHNLPQFKNLLRKGGPLKDDNAELMNMLSSWVGDDVRSCLVEAALNYTDAQLEITRPKDHKDEVDEKKELLYKIHQEEKAEELGEDGKIIEEEKKEEEKKEDEKKEEEEKKDEEKTDILEPINIGETEGIPDLEHASGAYVADDEEEEKQKEKEKPVEVRPEDKPKKGKTSLKSKVIFEEAFGDPDKDDKKDDKEDAASKERESQKEPKRDNESNDNDQPPPPKRRMRRHKQQYRQTSS